MSIFRESLSDALNWAKIGELPEKQDKRKSKKIWIAAIALVTKVDNSRNYAVVFNDGFGQPRIKKDFGKIALIKSIDELYPYDFLMEVDRPLLKNQLDIRNYVVSYGSDPKKIDYLLSENEADGTPKSEEKVKADLTKVRDYVDYHSIKNALKRKGYEKR